MDLFFFAWKNKHWGSENLPGYLIFNVPHFQKWLARSSPKCGKYYQDWNMYLKKITATQLYRYYVSSFDSRVSVFTRNVHVSAVWSSRPMKSSMCAGSIQSYKWQNETVYLTALEKGGWGALSIITHSMTVTTQCTLSISALTSHYAMKANSSIQQMLMHTVIITSSPLYMYS